jgi:hypothetical protein
MQKKMNPYDPLPPRRTTVNITPSLDFRYALDDVECETRARRKLVDCWGFDPEDVSKASIDWYESHLLPSSNIDYGERLSKAMVIFAHLGDLPMMRYILKKSNDPSGDLIGKDEYGLFPMYAAISKPLSSEHVLTTCQWLYNNGASIKQTVGGDWSPLARACIFDYDAVAIWLISSGALLDDNGAFDLNVAKRDLPSCGYETAQVRTADRVHRKIFEWANQIITVQENFTLFLTGTLQPETTMASPRPTVEQLFLSRGYFPANAVSFLLEDTPDEKLAVFLGMTESPLVMFQGHSGVLEIIANFVGFETNKTMLRTARGIVRTNVLAWALLPPSSGEPTNS